MKPLHQPENLRVTAFNPVVVGHNLVTPPPARPHQNRKAAWPGPGTFVLVSLLALFGSAPWGHTEDAPTLMTMITRWQYPEAKMHGATMSDAATVNGAGERTRQSIQYKAVLITKDPLAKVVAYYKTKLAPAAGSAAAKPEAPPAGDAGRSVTFQDDSDGRPLALHVILINTDEASTTLVISRAATESETHIAFTQYRKL